LRSFCYLKQAKNMAGERPDNLTSMKALRRQIANRKLLASAAWLSTSDIEQVRVLYPER
jgi:hypothetical protein